MKGPKRSISAALLCAVLLSLLTLGGCMSRRERRIRDDLNADGAVITAVVLRVDRGYIEADGFAVTEVGTTAETESGGKTLYECGVTVANAYVAATLPCTVTYGADDVFEAVEISAPAEWTWEALSGVEQTKVGYDELPNNDSVPYGECKVKSVGFSKRDQTCTVNVDVNADAGYVIASGELRIEFAYNDGKWAITGYSYGRDFAMSWDIGGLWEGDEWKWNKSSTMNLKLDFSIDSISPSGAIDSTVHSHIRSGNKDKEELFAATGTLDFATMTLTLDYENSSGPCRITAKFVKVGDKAARFEGEVVGTADNFRYYKGRFRRNG
ncbi:MAG: hypothetical protein IJU94_03810 [Clostridia bacterium]|nr:hypothetical protein [Clostridia bacterium]